MCEKDKPLFSVVIPVYNVRDYLNECIDSILKQSCRNYEIILVDDGSSDGSEAICDHYAADHSNITVIHKTNGGQSFARNVGINSARGQYFIFVDSDDYISDSTLEQFEDKIIKYGQLDVILSECMYGVEPDGKIVDAQGRLNASEYEGITGEQALTKMYETTPDWSPCGKCYRTEYWRDHGFAFMEDRVSEDLQLIDRVTLEAQNVAMISAHYYYRWKIQSSTMHGNFEKLVFDTIFVLADWNEYLNSRNLTRKLECAIRESLANLLEHTIMGNVFYIRKEKRNEAIDRVKEVSYYLNYDRSAEGKIIRASVALLGMSNTCLLLNKIKSIRKKKQNV